MNIASVTGAHGACRPLFTSRRQPTLVLVLLLLQPLLQPQWSRVISSMPGMKRTVIYVGRVDLLSPQHRTNSLLEYNLKTITDLSGFRCICNRIIHIVKYSTVPSPGGALICTTNSAADGFPICRRSCRSIFLNQCP